eukprot:TRINITY_DN52589_c0_g1_i1.p1 TRINITY_DN52589_c0_g1~~TRINITY_DN52589_c0_g1_i1.p1  ORF type:complete len:217 (-),score=7.88 TRINITY_DN52589_c0_g1_i1:71-721(-)
MNNQKDFKTNFYKPTVDYMYNWHLKGKPIKLFFCCSTPTFPTLQSVLICLELQIHTTMASCLLKVPGSKTNWVTFKQIPRLQTRRVYKVYAVASPVQKQFNFGQGSDTQVEPSNNKVTHKEIFTTSDGRQIDCLPWDYGFRSGVGRMYQEGYGRVPSNVLELLFQNIVAEFRGLLMFQEWMQPDKSIPESEELRSKLKELTLDDEAVRQKVKTQMN